MIFGSRKSKDAPAAPAAPATANGKAPEATAAMRAAAPAVAVAAPSPAKPDAVAASETTAGGPASEEARRRAAAAVRHSLAFAQIVSILMHSPRYRHYTLGDLEWLVLPPLLTGQCSVAEAKSKENGASVPVAVALWASVSADVDRRLTENLNTPIRLRPDEWRSGDILWLIDAVGDRRVVPGLLKQLADNTLKGREIKVRGRGEGGKVEVKNLQTTLQQAIAAAPAAAN
ncbi:MAG: toxin-activating lysine-acyltransferase [Hyphomicrobiaceae bacterium]